MSRQMRQCLLVGWLCIVGFMFIVGVAHATVPGQINYQGLLLDDLGDPVTGTPEMVFSLFSDPTGGSPLWSETHAAVSVLDGVYEVSLGSLTALAPSHLAGATVYLELEVDGETMTPRQRLLAVPYALQAEDANSVGGLSSIFTSNVYEHWDFDGGLPPNDDPTEGLADVDGDGKANFIDSDNDGDGISDVDELAQGSDINLITPTLAGFDVLSAETCVASPVQIQGDDFDSTMTVSFGSETPTAMNVTPTSLDVTVGPQPLGSVSVTITRPNGELDSSTFPFVDTMPNITGVSPTFVASGQSTTVVFSGTGFLPVSTVTLGSETPTAQNVTATSFEVNVGPQPDGLVGVTVTNVCGLQDMLPLSFNFGTPKKVFVTDAILLPTSIGGLSGADVRCANEATAAALSGTFLAWLSDGVDSPDTRFTQTSAYFLVDGTLVAADWADLTDGTLLSPINKNSTGVVRSSGIKVYSNVAIDGTTLSATNHCGAYSNTTGTRGFGALDTASDHWTNQGSANCTVMARLYCFEQ